MNKILLCLIVFLTVLIFLYIPKEKDSSGSKTRFITNTTPETASSISLFRSGDAYPILLKKKESTWVLSIDSVQEYPARSALINEMLHELSKSRIIYDTRSTDKATYGFNDTESIMLSIDNTVTLYFGDWSADGSDVYFTQKGSTVIYRTRDTFSQYLDTRTAIWAETEIWKFLSDKKIDRASYHAQNKSSVITDSTELDSLLHTLVYTRFLDITNIPGTNEEKIHIEFDDFSSLEFSLSSLNQGYYSITDKTSENSYVVSQSTAEQLREQFRRFQK